ncbi:MAG: LacI family transcriptional regulator [Oscillibacter sp.]|nr:LacI family transcriptional regulator [Oscillibacter sp.]
MRSVTIKDIARLSGVSVTTVSRALNNAPEISEETRERVLRVCREQGYRTNLLARSLISSRSHLLGLVLPELANPYHASLSLNIELCARELGYQIMLCCGRPEKGQMKSSFDLLLSQRVDGILMASTSDSAYALPQNGPGGVPCVVLGACAAESTASRANTVSVDNFMGGYMAAEYLFRLGHRNTAYLGLRPGSSTHTLRNQGFLTAARTLGMAVEVVENPDPSSSIESGCRMARQLFRRPGFCQTAVFAASDAVALGVIQVADELGLAIPEQLSVLGFDNIEYAALPNIRLTTVSQNTPLLARSAVRLLMELIESGEDAVYTRKLVTPSIIRRATCRPLSPDKDPHPPA